MHPDVRRKSRFPERAQTKFVWPRSGKRELSITFLAFFRLPPDCLGWRQQKMYLDKIPWRQSILHLEIEITLLSGHCLDFSVPSSVWSHPIVCLENLSLETFHFSPVCIFQKFSKIIQKQTVMMPFHIIHFQGRFSDIQII